MLYPLLIILILLAIIVFQDFKTRSIHWITLPPLFLALYFFPLDIINQFDVLQNFFFLVLIFAFMSLYLRFRQNEWVNPTKDFFGWGDILFLIAITPATYFRNFMFLFIFGTIFSLLFSIFLKIFNKNFSTIPYAGMFSIFMFFYLIYKHFHPNFSFDKLLH